MFDVAVDIRQGRATFGHWVGVELSSENRRQLWVRPRHGARLLVTSDSADFLYKTTDYYAPQSEGCILWSNPALAIEWPDLGTLPQLASKDAGAPPFSEAKAFGS